MSFGRTEVEWEAIVRVAISFLEHTAHQRKLTSYTEVNAAIGQLGYRMFDFTDPNGRRGIGAVLAEATKRTLDESGAMLSSIVYYLDRNDTGPGFFDLAVELGRLADTADKEERLAFWSGEMNSVHDFYRNRPISGEWWAGFYNL